VLLFVRTLSYPGLNNLCMLLELIRLKLLNSVVCVLCNASSMLQCLESLQVRVLPILR